MDEDSVNWDQWLSSAMHVHNHSVHSSTRQTPFKTLYGFDIDLPTNLKGKCDPLYNTDDVNKVMRFKIQRAHELVRVRQEKAKLESKKQYDVKTNAVSFAVGDKVLVRNFARRNKFSPIWKGPFEVVSVDSPVTSTLKMKGGRRKWHNNNLRPFYSAKGTLCLGNT